MTFKFIRDHAERWPIRLMCRVLEVSASGFMLGVTARKAPVHARTARCLVMSVVSMPSITAATAVPGCMPHYARKAARQAEAVSSV